MELFLGIDGGGSGCRAAVADADGRILGRGKAGPANIASDPGGAIANILAATRDALRSAGAPDELAGLTAGCGLAGANVAGAAGSLRAALPFARLRLETDAIAAAKGALGDADGIVAAIGTGSVFAVQRGGHVRQTGGWGLVLGDDGSGAWLGRGLLRQALCAAEGLRPWTPLLRRTLTERGGAAGVIAFSLAATPADFAALAPLVTETDDPAARSLMNEATEAVAGFLSALQGQPELAVTFIGGLGPVYSDRLADRWPIAPALGSALDGALLLAREAV